MPIEREFASPNSAGVVPHLPLFYSSVGARLDLGRWGFNPLIHLRLDGHIDQVSRVNHKGTPEHITKRKLAFEISKLVGDNIGAIQVCTTLVSVDQLVKPVGQAQTYCSDVTFDRLVLTGVFHVSKSSWQPLLWCEVTTPGRVPF